METYLNAFIRASLENKDFCGMPAETVKIIADQIIKERSALLREAAERAVKLKHELDIDKEIPNWITLDHDVLVKRMDDLLIAAIMGIKEEV